MKNLLNRYFSFVKKFIPEPEEKTFIGVDVGTNSCKMVEIKKKGSSFKLVDWGIEPTLAGEDKKQALQRILDKHSSPKNYLSTSVSGKGTLIRYLDMTRMALDDLKKSFAFESDKYFPFPADQIYTDCYILNPKLDGNKMSVMVAAAKKELIDDRIQLLTSLELPADFIGLNSIAIANVFNEFKLSDSLKTEEDEKGKVSKAVAVLDMGEGVSDLTILVDDLPRFTRDIFVGGHSFTRSISNALGVSLEEAEKMKCDPQDRLEDILNASDSAVLNLVSELRLSFDYFVNENNMPISQLIITGGASMTEGLTDVFSKYLEMPSKKWNPLEYVSLADSVSKDEIMKNAAKLGVAMGLALYQ